MLDAMTRLNSNMLTSRKVTGKKKKKNHITTCSTHCQSHQKTDWEGQKEARTGNKIAPASKPGVVPTTYHRYTAVWTKAKKNHRTFHRICFPEKSGMMLQKAIREHSLGLLKFSIVKNWIECWCCGHLAWMWAKGSDFLFEIRRNNNSLFLLLTN